MSQDTKVAVVLSGGGAKGAYAAGALGAIARRTEEIHIMTGASVGAINAALFAWHYEQNGDLIAAAEAVKAAWLDCDALFKISFWRIVAQIFCSYLRTRSPLNFASLVDTTRVKRQIQQLIPKDLKISDLTRIELAINATCLTEGKTVSFTRKNDAYLWQAVLASCSIPLLFETQCLGGGFYVDGGLFNNTPLRDALVAQATDVFVVELKPKAKEVYLKTIHDTGPYSSIAQVGGRMAELITDKIMYEDLKKARKINEIIDIILALEASGTHPHIVANLKKSIGYQKNGTIKRHVNFYEVAPSKRLEPPGTLGFHQTEVLRKIIRLGEMEAKEQLQGIFVGACPAAS